MTAAYPSLYQTMCTPCASGRHGDCERRVRTGRMVPDTDPYRDRAGWVREVVECACVPCSHVVSVVPADGVVMALCSCGWAGPDRSDDPHAAILVEDDAEQHAERVGS